MSAREQRRYRDRALRVASGYAAEADRMLRPPDAGADGAGPELDEDGRPVLGHWGPQVCYLCRSRPGEVEAESGGSHLPTTRCLLCRRCAGDKRVMSAWVRGLMRERDRARGRAGGGR